jgi:hypothetical protein
MNTTPLETRVNRMNTRYYAQKYDDSYGVLPADSVFRAFLEPLLAQYGYSAPMSTQLTAGTDAEGDPFCYGGCNERYTEQDRQEVYNHYGPDTKTAGKVDEVCQFRNYIDDVRRDFQNSWIGNLYKQHLYLRNNGKPGAAELQTDELETIDKYNGMIAATEPFNRPKIYTNKAHWDEYHTYLAKKYHLAESLGDDSIVTNKSPESLGDAKEKLGQRIAEYLTMMHEYNHYYSQDTSDFGAPQQKLAQLSHETGIDFSSLLSEDAPYENYGIELLNDVDCIEFLMSQADQYEGSRELFTNMAKGLTDRYPDIAQSKLLELVGLYSGGKGSEKAFAEPKEDAISSGIPFADASGGLDGISDTEGIENKFGGGAHAPQPLPYPMPMPTAALDKFKPLYAIRVVYAAKPCAGCSAGYFGLN